MPNPDFYVTGSTVSPTAACYIEPRADAGLLAALHRGEFRYVPTSRQNGILHVCR